TVPLPVHAPERLVVTAGSNVWVPLKAMGDAISTAPLRDQRTEVPFITMGREMSIVPEFFWIWRIVEPFIVILPGPPTSRGWLEPAVNMRFPSSTTRFPLPDTVTAAKFNCPVPFLTRLAFSTSDPLGAAPALSLVPRIKT